MRLERKIYKDVAKILSIGLAMQLCVMYVEGELSIYTLLGFVGLVMLGIDIALYEGAKIGVDIEDE